MARGGEIIILDMGDPVKIVDLARDLINSQVFEPDVDIPISLPEFVPGKKLYEDYLRQRKDKPYKTFPDFCR